MKIKVSRVVEEEVDIEKAPAMLLAGKWSVRVIFTEDGAIIYAPGIKSDGAFATELLSRK